LNMYPLQIRRESNFAPKMMREEFVCQPHLEAKISSLTEQCESMGGQKVRMTG
jgi:hypothetical protein